MKRIARCVLLFACLGAGPALAGDTLFVTDKVLAKLYASQDAQEPVGRLPTGTRVEVLQKVAGYARVRLPGGDEGWVEARWLSDQEPAQSILLRLADDYERTRQELATLQAARQPERPFEKLPLWTLVAIAGGGLLLGFIIGVTWLDRRYRDRHGGFRL